LVVVAVVLVSVVVLVVVVVLVEVVVVMVIFRVSRFCLSVFRFFFVGVFNIRNLDCNLNYGHALNLLSESNN